MYSANIQSPISREELDMRLSRGLERLQLNITHHCNMRCRYCYYSGSYSGERTHCNTAMPGKTVSRAMDFFRERATPDREAKIVFYGGEPLTEYRRIRNIIESEHSGHGNGKAQFEINTNALLLNRIDVSFFARHCVDLVISLDGPEPVNDRYRVSSSGKGTFSRVYRNIERLAGIDRDYFKKHVRIIATLVPPFELLRIHDFFVRDPVLKLAQAEFGLIKLHNTEFISNNKPDWRRFYSERSVLREKYMTLTPRGKKNNHLLRSLFMPDELIGAIREQPKRFGMTLNMLPCVPGADTTFVDIDGGIYACEKLAGKGMSLGNVRTGFDRKRIWRMIDEFLKKRRALCSNCDIARYCNVCFIHMAGISPEQTARDFCKMQKRLIRRILRELRDDRHTDQENAPM